MRMQFALMRSKFALYETNFLLTMQINNAYKEEPIIYVSRVKGGRGIANRQFSPDVTTCSEWVNTRSLRWLDSQASRNRTVR